MENLQWGSNSGMIKIKQRIKVLFLVLVAMVGWLSCNLDDAPEFEIEGKTAFDKVKWGVKEGKDYPYRDQMVNDVVYNDTIRTLGKVEIMELLGEPDRINNGHLYYMIRQSRLASWPLHTKTMVIKLSDTDKVDWIKIHE